MDEGISQAISWATAGAIILGSPMLIYGLGSTWLGDVYRDSRRSFVRSYYGLTFLLATAILISHGTFPVVGWEMAVTIFSAPYLAVIGMLIMPLRKRFNGRCHHCGYDMRFTPEQCPECGQVIPADVD